MSNRKRRRQGRPKSIPCMVRKESHFHFILGRKRNGGYKDDKGRDITNIISKSHEHLPRQTNIINNLFELITVFRKVSGYRVNLSSYGARISTSNKYD
jgi:hypothetical protein